MNKAGSLPEVKQLFALAVVCILSLLSTGCLTPPVYI